MSPIYSRLSTPFQLATKGGPPAINWLEREKGDGSEDNPWNSATEARDNGMTSDGNAWVYVFDDGKRKGDVTPYKMNVFMKQSHADGGWVLVTRARDNSTCHHSVNGGGGGDNGPINQSGNCHSYSDKLINDLMMGNLWMTEDSEGRGRYQQSAGSTKRNVMWYAYMNGKSKYMYGYNNPVFNNNKFISNQQADGTGWDLIRADYGTSSNVDLCGNYGSQGFGDHHCNTTYFAYNRHSNNNGFAHDNYNQSDGVFFVRY